MADTLFKTNGDASPSGKARVYFTCHPNTLNELTSHADMLFDTRQYEKAAEMYTRLYETCLGTFGVKFPETICALHNIGASLSELGELYSAIEIFDKAYTLKCDVFGSTDASTVHSLISIGDTYRTC